MNDAYEVVYDGEADALTLNFRKDFIGRVRTIQTGKGLLFDEVDGEIVSMEVLQASRHPIFCALLPKVEGLTLHSYTRTA